MNEQLIKELTQFGVVEDLVQPGNEQVGSDFAMPCFSLAKKLNKSPQDIAEEIAKKIKHDDILKSEAIAGYLNIWLSDQKLFMIAESACDTEKPYKDKTIVCEYGDPNPLKVLHAGHLYTGVVGDSIANLYEFAGGNVHRVNFGGDVGLHIGMAMWSILKSINNDPTQLDKLEPSERQDWLSQRYVEGTAAYEEDDLAKKEIIELNKDVYRIHRENDKDSVNARVYWTCRKWSYDYFDDFYAALGVEFEKYYPESAGEKRGVEIVKDHIKDGVYVESDGAIIFEGEKHGLHNRVFINSVGLPTYETKDVGLIFNKWDDYNFDESVVITDSSQKQYMEVVLKSIEQYEPQLVERSHHLTHGRISLSGGRKMSSRKGKVVKAVDILAAVDQIIEESQEEVIDKNSQKIAAVKYAFLKVTIGQNIIYDPEMSVSTSGDSGPYLQYAHARACSITNKSKVDPEAPVSLDENERVLVRKIADFNATITEALQQLAPNKICNYLFELTQAFNRFYENNQVIGSDREAQRHSILTNYKKVLAIGLNLLGIEAPEKM